MILISDGYKQILESLHEEGKFNKGKGRLPTVRPFLDRFKPKSLIDYGCGHGGLIHAIAKNYPDIQVTGYDPGNSLFNQLPTTSSEALVCIDVIEHLEPETLDDNLTMIGQLATKYLYLNVACYPAAKTLPDGRNAHLIIENIKFWRQKFEQFYGSRIEFKKSNSVSYRPGKMKSRPELTAIIEL